MKKYLHVFNWIFITTKKFITGFNKKTIYFYIEIHTPLPQKCFHDWDFYLFINLASEPSPGSLISYVISLVNFYIE